MSDYHQQRQRTTRPAWDEGQTQTVRRREPEGGGGAGYAVAFLLLLAVAILCVSVFLVVRLFVSGPSDVVPPALSTWTATPAATTAGGDATVQPTAVAPGEAALGLVPEQGYINTLITVNGQGWWPGEPVFVFLRSPEEGDGRGYSYAAAVADDQGTMRTAFTFPNEMRWLGQPWADVIARGTRSGREASARFTLVAPTPTPSPIPPTARPTSAVTDTPPPTDSPPPTETPIPTEVIITDWRGEYYDNMSLAGEPVLVRNDVRIDFDWGEGSPANGLPADQFSVRWTRRMAFGAGRYRFTLAADDGLRFWIDGQLFLDDWQDGGLNPHDIKVDLGAGEHTLQLDYYENLGAAAAQLSWTQSQEPTPTPSPTATPTPSPTPTASPTPTPSPLPSATVQPPAEHWQGMFFDNPTLSGFPVLVRNDAEINFDWGTASPGFGLPADGFSARWLREVWAPAGTYRFYLDVDDGVRFWVDGLLLIDEWHPARPEIYQAEAYLPEGVHRLKIEYYEGEGNARIRYWGETVSTP